MTVRSVSLHPPRGVSRPLTGALWRRPDFRRLWASQTISLLGSEITLLALPLAAIALGAGAKEMGWLTAIRFLPTLLLGLLVGAWVDRLPRRPLLIATDLGRGAVLAAVPLAALTGHLRLELLYPLAFLAAALAVLGDVAHATYLPVLVERERLVEGNSTLAVGDQAARIVGPTVAGALVQAASAPFALLADAVSFLCSATLLGTIRTREPALAPGRGPGGPRAIWRQVGEGVRFVVGDPVLRPLTGVWGLYFFAFFLFWAQFPLFAIRDLGLSPAMLGAIGSAGAVGGVLGALATGRITARWGLGPTLAGAVLVGALGVLVNAAAGGPPLAAAAVLLVGQFLVRFTDQLFAINYTSACQTLPPDRLRGRVNASVRVLTAGAAPVGALLGGLVAGAIGLRALAVVAGLGVVVAFLWLALSPVRSLRKLSDASTETAPDASAGTTPAPAVIPAEGQTPRVPASETG